jgi:hypothetical protein
MSRKSTANLQQAARTSVAPAGLAVLAAFAALSPTTPVRAQAEAPPPASGTSTQLAAQWVPKEARFTYQGFTSRYSCDGLRDKVREALLKLGARPDLTVRATGCSSPAGAPDPFPGVTIKMQVLKPADMNALTALQTVPAHWKSIDLKLNRDALSEAGDCELIEQIKHSLLPLFTTRNVDFSSTCVPHQLSPGGTRLSAEILVSDAPPNTPAAPAGTPTAAAH